MTALKIARLFAMALPFITLASAQQVIAGDPIPGIDVSIEQCCSKALTDRANLIGKDSIDMQFIYRKDTSNGNAIYDFVVKDGANYYNVDTIVSKNYQSTTKVKLDSLIGSLRVSSSHSLEEAINAMIAGKNKYGSSCNGNNFALCIAETKHKDEDGVYFFDNLTDNLQTTTDEDGFYQFDDVAPTTTDEDGLYFFDDLASTGNDNDEDGEYFFDNIVNHTNTDEDGEYFFDNISGTYTSNDEDGEYFFDDIVPSGEEEGLYMFDNVADQTKTDEDGEYFFDGAAERPHASTDDSGLYQFDNLINPLKYDSEYSDRLNGITPQATQDQDQDGDYFFDNLTRRMPYLAKFSGTDITIQEVADSAFAGHHIPGIDAKLDEIPGKLIVPRSGGLTFAEYMILHSRDTGSTVGSNRPRIGTGIHELPAIAKFPGTNVTYADYLAFIFDVQKSNRSQPHQLSSKPNQSSTSGAVLISNTYNGPLNPSNIYQNITLAHKKQPITISKVRIPLLQHPGGESISWFKVTKETSPSSTNKYWLDMPESSNNFLLGDFNNDGKSDFLIERNGQYLISQDGILPFTPAFNDNNKPGDIRVGDVDGNGSDDLVTIVNGKTYYKPNLAASWVYKHNISVEIDEIELGYFNADAQADIIYKTGTYHRWAKYNLRSVSSFLLRSTTNMSKMRHGDFNGDGIDDIFLANGTVWLVTYSGKGSWDTIKTDSTPDSRLHLTDIDRNGTTDVLRHGAHGWEVSKNGREQFVRLIDFAY